MKSVGFIRWNRCTAILRATLAEISLNAAKECRLKRKRIGIYAGSFDPVHAGHVAFGLRVLKVAKLDVVYFMPERNPRGKQVEHYGHRVAMVSRALRPYKKMQVLETVQMRFAVRSTMVRLREQFPEASFVFLLGSDAAKTLPSWPHIEQLLAESELCVALRKQDSKEEIMRLLQAIPVTPIKLWLIEGAEKEVSSSTIRTALSANKWASGLLKSVYNYARREWLYIRN